MKKVENNPMQSKYSFLDSPRCGAKTRQGTMCRAPAVKDKRRCRMHGGATGSGAPLNNQNALKHGFSTKHASQIKKSVSMILNNNYNFGLFLTK